MYKRQAKIAADEINANGGFNGYQVEILDAGDDQGDPEKAVNAYNDLLDKGMQMQMCIRDSTWQIQGSKKTTAGFWFMCRTMLTLLPIVGLVGSNNLSTAIIILGIRCV